MLPVIVLSDGYLANGAEPWRIPELDELGEIPVALPHRVRRASSPTRATRRPWPGPGRSRAPRVSSTASAASRSRTAPATSATTPLNHEKMVRLRAAKVEAVVADVPDVVPAGDPEGDLLVIGWGSTYGAITAALGAGREQGHKVGHVHLRHLNPFPAEPRRGPEALPSGARPRAEHGPAGVRSSEATYLVDDVRYNKVQGKPFKHSELKARMEELLSGRRDDEHRRRCRSTRRRTSRATRTCAGARAAGTTRSSPRCSRSSPTSGSRRRSSWWCPGSAAPAASRTT